jgi:phosphoribosylglycinamide formyltransferase-1
MSLVKVAIFASGTGSNAQALMKKAQELPHVEISFVLSDKAEAMVLEKARALNVKTFVVEKTGSKSSHEESILQLLKEHRIEWIFLAGYMRLLSADFLKTFASWQRGRLQVVNIHPSLLPAYPGVNSIERAFNDHVDKTGVTLHLVDEGVDTGPILKQSEVKLMSNETLDSLATKIHATEHRLYTEFLAELHSEG